MTDQGLKTLKWVIDRARLMAGDTPKPRPICWIAVNGEYLNLDYCPGCAELIVSWISDGGEQPEFWDHEEYPRFASVDKEDNYIVYDYSSYESDSCVHCEHCGHQLDVVLTDHGIDSELDHFEYHSIKADDWWHFLAICFSISGRAKKHEGFIQRAVGLVKNYQ